MYSIIQYMYQGAATAPSVLLPRHLRLFLLLCRLYVAPAPAPAPVPAPAPANRLPFLSGTFAHLGTARPAGGVPVHLGGGAFVGSGHTW